MKREKPLVDKKYRLERFPGKGGWTYASIPEVLQDKHNPFGWVTVKGSIDGYPLKQYKLMPMGNGKLFLPVRAAIRKAIGKQEGDWVRVTLFEDKSALEVPEDFMACLREEPKALAVFEKLTEGQRKLYVDWIYSARKEDTRVDRIVQAIERLSRNLKFGEED